MGDSRMKHNMLSQMKIAAGLLFLLSTMHGCGETVEESNEETEGVFDALTYNVAGLPQGISSSDPASYTPMISPLLNAFDLVLVQEDFVYHRDLKRDSEHLYESEPKDPIARIMADGLNRFSDFPFDTLYREQWADCYGTAEGGNVTGAGDCLAEKGFSVARTTLAPGVEIDVYNHHAEAGGGTEDDAIRAAGFEQLTAYIQANSAGQAILIAGDTNLSRDDEQDGPVLQKFMADNQLQDACTVLACEVDKIDRFFFRNNEHVTLTPISWRIADEFVTDEGQALSDHVAIHVEFRWESVLRAP